jgi:tetratricopeptide (TPR) repeat protein/DNA-binding CsgD family transcriptional regulator
MRLLLALLLTLGTFSLCFSQSKQTKSTSSENEVFNNLQTLLKEKPEAYQKEFVELETKWNEAGNRELLLKLYFFQFDYLLEQGRYDAGLIILHKGRRLYSNASDQALIPVYLNFASVFHYKANLDSMIYYQDLAKRNLGSNSPHYGQYLLNEGLKSQLNAEFQKAIPVIFEAISFYEKNKDLKRLAVAYNNLAFNYEKIGDQDSQIKYLFKSLELNKIYGSINQVIINYNNIGIYFKDKGEFERGIAYYDLAFEEIKKLNNPLLLAQNLLNRANIFKRKGELLQAEKLFLESLALCEANKIDFGIMLCMLNLGELHISLQRFGSANAYLTKAYELSKTLQARREQALTFERLGWLSRDMGDYRAAYDWQTKFHGLNDSLINESVKKEANALREKFEVEKKENEIISLSKDKIYQQFVIVLMALGLLVLLLILILWNHKRKLAEKEKEKEVLQRSHMKDLLKSKDEEMRVLARQLLDMQSELGEAKMKISSVLHADSIDQQKFKKIDAILNTNPFESMKVDLDARMTANNVEFFNLLLNQFPDLSPSELKLCAYLRLNMSTKDISEILSRSVRTVENTRANIRKKMFLEPQDNLVSYLMGFVEAL